MRSLFISIISWIFAIVCQGQATNPQNNLSFSLGVGHIARQDLIFSSLIHRDLSVINLGLEYSREGTVFQKGTLRYATYTPMVLKPYQFAVNNEGQTAGPHYFTLLDADYLVGKVIKETEKFTITGGGLFSADIQALNYVYGRISSFGYYSTFGLGVFGKKEFIIDEKNRLAGTLQLPLVVWLARSPYLVNDDEFIENISSHSGWKSFWGFVGDGGLATWNRVQTFDLEINYSYRLNRQWALGAAYLLEFIHASKTRTLFSYRNSLNLSTNLSF